MQQSWPARRSTPWRDAAWRAMPPDALGGWLCDCAQLRLLDQLAYFEAAANPFIDEASPNPSLVSNHAVSGNGP